jgi:putative zinc finger/helix-turn-helix YgiT family protein
MTEQLSCPACETVREVEPVERDETVSIRGRPVTFRARAWRCRTCQAEFETPAQLDGNLDAAREAYAQTYEARSAEQLVALRARYGASQKAFGLILGLGELTMNSYEQGGTPAPANRLLLKLAENPVFFKAMYAVNSRRIGAIQRKRIEASHGFRSADSWPGLEALAASLTAVQRDKVEACAANGQQSVLQQVVAYVSAGSFEEYSNLEASAR